MYPNKIIIAAVFLCLIAGALYGQDSLGVKSDSNRTALWPNLLKSAIVPGWGQIGQERPLSALLYYASGVSFAYGMAYNYKRNNSSHKEEKYRQRFWWFTGLYGGVVLINMADIVYANFKLKPKKWQSKLFSDTPLKSPWGAVARSAMLPGWGQVYNESYIKSAIAFSLCAIFARNVYIHNKRYKENPGPVERDRRSANAWYLGLTYAVGMMDAFVDAYLYRFNDMMVKFITVPDKEGLAIGAVITF